MAHSLRNFFSNAPKTLYFARDFLMAGIADHAWRKALIRAGIKDFRWHDLRHTWASWHVQSGTPLHELQQLGGWSNYETVLRYAHLSSEHLRMAAERIHDTKLSQ